MLNDFICQFIANFVGNLIVLLSCKVFKQIIFPIWCSVFTFYVYQYCNNCTSMQILEINSFDMLSAPGQIFITRWLDHGLITFFYHCLYLQTMSSPSKGSMLCNCPLLHVRASRVLLTSLLVLVGCSLLVVYTGG